MKFDRTSAGNTSRLRGEKIGYAAPANFGGEALKTDCRTWKQVSDRLCLVSLFVLASAAGGKGEEVSSSAGQCAINAVYGTFATGGRLAATGFAFDSEGGAPVQKVALYLRK